MAAASVAIGTTERRRLPGLVAESVDLVVHGAKVRLIASEDSGDGALEEVGADLVEHLQEARGRSAEVVAAFSETLHHRSRRRHRREEAVEAAALVCAPLLLGEAAKVALVFHALVAVECSRMIGKRL